MEFFRTNLEMHVPSSRCASAFLPRFQISFHRMHFTIEMFFEELNAHVGWNAVETACRYNVDAFFTCQIIVFELHALYKLWFSTDINVMCAGIDATCPKKKKKRKINANFNETANRLYTVQVYTCIPNIPCFDNWLTIETIWTTAIDNNLKSTQKNSISYFLPLSNSSGIYSPWLVRPFASMNFHPPHRQ